MIDRKEEKQIEEYIRQLFQNYSPFVSDAEKSEIINSFQNFHIHDNSLQFNIKEILKNKTLHFIILAITFTVLLIYLFTKLFPAEENKVSSNNKNNNFIEQFSAEDSVSNVNLQNSSISEDTILSSKKTVITYTSINTSSINTTNKNSSNVSDSNIILKQNKNTILSDTSKVIKNLSDTSKVIKKKKKRKNNSDFSKNDSENNSPILEPKTPQLNIPVKEEE